MFAIHEIYRYLLGCLINKKPAIADGMYNTSSFYEKIETLLVSHAIAMQDIVFQPQIKGRRLLAQSMSYLLQL